MNTLHTEIWERPLKIFSTDEMTEMIQSIYLFISNAFRDGCSEILLTRKEIVRLKDDRIIGAIPAVYGVVSLYETMYSALLKVLQRDSLLHKHVEITDQTTDYLRLKLSE